MRRCTALAVALMLAAVLAPVCAADDLDPKSILAKADQYRFPQEGFQVDVRIESSAPDRDPEIHKYQILSKGNENTIVVTSEPANERGQVLLMKSRDLWVYLPDLSQPVRLSLSQKLTGEVSNGDLARANFSGDYTPALSRSETIDNENFHVLELSANDRGVTYHRVLFWVRQSDARPLKAEFYSLSNRLLKTCRYDTFTKMAGQVRPSRLIMEDAIKPNEKSTLEYTNMRLRDLPEKVFTKDYLKRLQ